LKTKLRNRLGLLPKNTQQLVILGVAVVMVLIMWADRRRKAQSDFRPRLHKQGRSCKLRTPATVEDFKQTIQQEQAATRQAVFPSFQPRPAAKQWASRADVPPGGTQ